MKNEITNLNTINIATEGSADEPQEDYSTHSSNVSVYFKDLEAHLIKHIEEAELVVGCVAWMTSFPILEALSKKRVAIVIQKEDFCRPDMEKAWNSSSLTGNVWADKDYWCKDGWKGQLATAYGKLQPGASRYDNVGRLSMMSCCCDSTIDPVRCVGNYNSDKRPSNPRCHHKFVVFCKYIPTKEEGFEGELVDSFYIQPYKVWTGSFNFTRNGGMSFENAVVMSDPKIATAYYNEWAQVEALSEPLDWSSEWCEPEWRIGT